MLVQLPFDRLAPVPNNHREAADEKRQLMYDLAEYLLEIDNDHPKRAEKIAFQASNMHKKAEKNLAIAFKKSQDAGQGLGMDIEALTTAAA